MIDKPMLHVMEDRVVDGPCLGAREDKALDAVEAALSLVRLHDATRYRQVKRDLERVLVVVLVGGQRAEYNAWFGACSLEERYVIAPNTTAMSIASSVVHEATHARLDRLGFRYVEQDRPRHEAIRMRRQVAFLKHVPGAETELSAVTAQWEHVHQWTEEGFWGHTAFVERRTATEKAAVRHLGFPMPVIPVLKSVAWCLYRVRDVRHWLRAKRRPTG